MPKGLFHTIMKFHKKCKITQAKGGVNFPLKLINLQQNFTNLLGETPDTSCFHFGLLNTVPIPLYQASK